MSEKPTNAVERSMPFVRINEPSPKPRRRGVTEIRGPYYAPVGTGYLRDILETMGAYVDSLKFAGGSFALMPRKAVQDIIDLCHAHEVMVSTGGFIEYVLIQGPDVVRQYVDACRDLGFDIVEVSTGFITTPFDDLLRLVGSEGITESVNAWRTDVPAKFVDALGLEKVMFEAADPAVFAWYVKNYGPEVNLFVDHSQIVQLECLRTGIWGTKSLWGRVLTYKG